jgi:hypothetical protein
MKTFINYLMKGLGIENKITLNHIVLGYKIDDKNYLALNFLITVVGFSIYKLYYISEQKTKYIDVYRIFADEYIKRINENKTLQKCFSSSFWCFPVTSCSDYPGL